MHAILKGPPRNLYQEQIEHRFNDVRDALERIQAHSDSPAMHERDLVEYFASHYILKKPTAFLVQTLRILCITVKPRSRSNTTIFSWIRTGVENILKCYAQCSLC